MTDRTEGFRLNQDGIVVAVLPEFLHDKTATRGRTLVPHLLTATAPEPDVPTGNGKTHCLRVHVAQHENFIGIGILNNGRNKTFIFIL